MTKKVGYILEKIADLDNLRAADMEAQKGKVNRNRHIRRHNARAEEDLLLLRDMICNLDFPPPKFTTMLIKSDAGKVRKIVKQNYFPWCIAYHAILRVIGPIIERNSINDTFACVKGKGLHFGVQRMKRLMRLHRELKWFWKTDYKKFYESTPHSSILLALNHKFKDARFIKLIEITLFGYESGEDIKKELRDEEIRKKRFPNRCLHKSAHRYICNR
ncbi:MAG: reverse transcriptase [Bacteroidaceae bacterium]